jgi:D-alanyl-D-alanine carboxypeptidase
VGVVQVDVLGGVAEHVGGTMKDFVAMMNARAKSLGCVNTNFVNPHGLHEEGHYVCAYDMALIAAEAIKNESFNRYFSTNRYDMSPTNIRSEMRQFWNANYFINGYEQCEGLIMSKTGWTQEARHTLVTAAKRGDTTLVAVVMYSTGKGDKFDDTLALFDYGFNGYTTVQVTDDYIKSSMPAKLECAEGEIAVQQEDCMTGAVYVTAPVGTQEKDITVSVGEAQVEVMSATNDCCRAVSSTMLFPEIFLQWSMGRYNRS